jgi:hypothetical protein
MNMGPRVVAVPEVKYSVIMPPVATSMATGNRRAIGFAARPSELRRCLQRDVTLSHGRSGKSRFTGEVHRLKDVALPVSFHPQAAKLLRNHARTPSYGKCAGVIWG